MTGSGRLAGVDVSDDDDVDVDLLGTHVERLQWDVTIAKWYLTYIWHFIKFHQGRDRHSLDIQFKVTKMRTWVDNHITLLKCNYTANPNLKSKQKSYVILAFHKYYCCQLITTTHNHQVVVFVWKASYGIDKMFKKWERKGEGREEKVKRWLEGMVGGCRASKLGLCTHHVLRCTQRLKNI